MAASPTNPGNRPPRTHYGPEDEARLAAYVARVAALTASDWGRLDAIGTSLGDGWPASRWDRAAIDASAIGLMRGRRATPKVALSFAARLAFEGSIRIAVEWDELVNGAPTCDRFDRSDYPPPAESPVPDVAELQARQRRFIKAFQVALDSQPGRTDAVDHGFAATRCLEYGFHALMLGRSVLGDRAFARVYGVVEPVIPFASLSEQRLIGAPAEPDESASM